MKTLTPICFLLVVCISFLACTKVPHGNSPPGPDNLFFELIDKDGKSVVTSIKDKVSISYVDDGVTKSKNLVVDWFYEINTINGTHDTTKFSNNYNGFYIIDKASIGELSNRKINAIHNFNIYLNEKSIGVLYIANWPNGNGHPDVSPQGYTFNDIPVSFAKVASMPLNLFQVNK